MSYIRSKDTYAYDTDEGLVIHSNCVVEHDPLHEYQGVNYRYILTIPPQQFDGMVRRILEQTAPPWAKNRKMVNECVKRWRSERKAIG